MTQAQIAEPMNLTRQQINELLSEVLTRGVVQISFTFSLTENVQLEGQLCEALQGSDPEIAIVRRQHL